MAYIVVWSRIYERFRKAVIAGRLVRVTGRIERDGRVVHIIAERVEDISPMLSTLARPTNPDVTGARVEEASPHATAGPQPSAASTR